MKLKLIVASMSILGVICCPVYAGHAKKHKMKHHAKMMTVQHDYKDMGALAVQEPVCVIKASTMTMLEMTQNMGRSVPSTCNPGWYNRIAISGGINVDAGKFGNRNANIMGENYQVLSLNDAYLNVAANVNDWAHAFASISYMTATTNANPGTFNQFGAAEYSAAYSNNINSGSANLIQLEQAFLTIQNSDWSPIFFQAGKQFQDFSRYEIHPITRSMTQVMSETLATSLKLGFIADGFSGSLSVFDDPINKVNNTHPTNFIAALGYDHNSDQLGFDLGAAYIYNMIGVNDIAYNVVNFTGGDYNKRVAGAALYADVNSGPFVLGARYTTALQRFNVNDLPRNGVADLTGGNIFGVPIAGRNGAQPWAAGIQAGYGFNYWDRNQNVFIAYQASREAAGLNLPRGRWALGYGIAAWQATNLGVEWDHDNLYSASNGGKGGSTNLVSFRAGVAFS